MPQLRTYKYTYDDQKICNIILTDEFPVVKKFTLCQITHLLWYIFWSIRTGLSQTLVVTKYWTHICRFIVIKIQSTLISMHPWIPLYSFTKYNGRCFSYPYQLKLTRRYFLVLLNVQNHISELCQLQTTRCYFLVISIYESRSIFLLYHLQIRLLTHFKSYFSLKILATSLLLNQVHTSPAYFVSALLLPYFFSFFVYPPTSVFSSQYIRWMQKIHAFIPLHYIMLRN